MGVAKIESTPSTDCAKLWPSRDRYGAYGIILKFVASGKSFIYCATPQTCYMQLDCGILGYTALL